MTPQCAWEFCPLFEQPLKKDVRWVVFSSWQSRTGIVLFGGVLGAAVLVCVAGAHGAYAANASGPAKAQNATSVVSSVYAPVQIGVQSTMGGPLFPLVSQSPAVRWLDGLQFGTLLQLTPTLSVAPELAQKWWYEKNGTQLWMQLNPHAVWSNGAPVTAQDVGLCVNFLASPYYNTTLQGSQGFRVLPIVGSRTEMSGRASSVSGFHIVNSEEFYFQLHAVDPSALINDFQGITPLPSALLGHIPMTQWLSTPFAANPQIGTGPYLLTGHTASNAKLSANPRFVLGVPSIPRMAVKSVSNVAAPGLFRAGQVDVMGNLSSQLANALKGMPGATVTFFPGNHYRFLGWNDQVAPGSSALFRQAVMYAINRQAIISKVLHGAGVVENGPLPPVSVWYDNALNSAYPYNPQEARNLLIKAGFYIGPGAWLVQKNGSALTPTIAYAQGDPYGAQVAQMIVGDLRAVAIDAKAVQLPVRTLIQDLSSHTSSPQGFLLGWDLGNDPNPSSLWLSSAPFNQQTINWTSQNDPNVAQSDQLITEQASLQALNPQYRASVLMKWQQLISTRVPADFLFDADRAGVVSSRIQGVVWSPGGSPIDPWLWSLHSGSP